jgi:gas vesicle protein
MPHNTTAAANNNNRGAGGGSAWKNAKQTGLYISGAGALVGGAVALGFSMLKAAETLKGISRASDEIDQKLKAFDESVKSKDRNMKVLIDGYFSQKKEYEQQFAEAMQKISADAPRRLDEAMEKNSRRFTEELRETMADDSRKNTEAIDKIRELFADEIKKIREEDNDKFALAVEQISEINREEWQDRKEAWQRTYTDQVQKMSELEAKMTEYVHQAHGPQNRSTYGNEDYTMAVGNIREKARGVSSTIKEGVDANAKMISDILQGRAAIYHQPPGGAPFFDPEEPKSYQENTAAAALSNHAAAYNNSGNEEDDGDHHDISDLAMRLKSVKLRDTKLGKDDQ